MLLLALLGACASPRLSESLPRGEAAYQLIPAAAPDKSLADYRINPLDAVDVNIYGEPDLSVKAVQIDAAGELALPLVGTVPAAGKTAAELSRDLQQRFGQ